ncbi:unnamed protein product [Larinioides sclopetarius]|uniref:Uncharacterized protein n=1 Tax=Larinioides sclopetarius TaxID=280406 RepID=A0AAV1ZX53_9ARAC
MLNLLQTETDLEYLQMSNMSYEQSCIHLRRAIQYCSPRLPCDLYAKKLRDDRWALYVSDELTSGNHDLFLEPRNVSWILSEFDPVICLNNILLSSKKCIPSAKKYDETSQQAMPWFMRDPPGLPLGGGMSP